MILLICLGFTISSGAQTKSATGRTPAKPGTPAATALAFRAPSNFAVPAQAGEKQAAGDPLIEQARDAAFSFSDKLPNFLCQEVMARFSSRSTASGWQSLDVISADIIYEDQQEQYKNLKIDGRPTEKKMEELSGAWSTGEFATTLTDLFHPSTAAQFRSGGESPLAGAKTRVYDFTVRQENSHWVVQSGSQSVRPSYAGSIWIDPQNARVMRLEKQAVQLPQDFPMDTVESVVDYSWVRIGEESVLLPVHAETLGCQRGTPSCSRNVIDFRGYRKYSSDSKIIF